MNSSYFSAKRITWFAILLALVVVLQIWGSAIPIGATRISFVLIPIVLGAIVLGAVAGALLGVAFGVVVLIAALVGADPFTLYLFESSPVMTLLIIFVKGALAGFVPGLIFKALRKKNSLVATFIAAAAAPICNTGIFIVGTLIISGVISNYISITPDLAGQSVVYFIIIGCAGLNFLIELGINMLITPALYRVMKVIDKSAGGFLGLDQKENERKKSGE